MGKFFDSLDDPKGFNLEAFNEALIQSVIEYETHLGQKNLFPPGSFQPFQLTPEKGYSARANMSFYSHGRGRYADFVLFAPGDGTGTEETFKALDLSIPNRLRFSTKPERVYPRAKDCYAEFAFPLMSVSQDRVYRGVVSLERLTASPEAVTPRIVTNTYDLGVSPATYEELVERGLEIRPYIQMTVRTNEDGSRRGDPHAIFSNPIVSSQRVQVVGFLSVKDKEDPIYNILNSLVSQ